MAITSGGQHESGLDRALDLAYERELDTILESGELAIGTDPAVPTVAAAKDRQPWPQQRPWQLPLTVPRSEPKPGTTLWQDVRAGLDALLARLGSPRPQPPAGPPPGDPPPSGGQPEGAPPSPASAEPPPSAAKAVEAHPSTAAVPGHRDHEFRFLDDRVGIVVVHGVGLQLAGQTLLDWTRPIIELMADWREVHRTKLADLPGQRYLTDPVTKANIDFSGATFPTVQLWVPGLRTFEPGDPRATGRRWVFTEAWWAQEVRPPTLATMIGWLGDQGGVGRIVSGIIDNTFGGGRFAWLAKVSLRAFISVIVSFVLLLYFVLLGVVKLVPFGPLRNAVVLQLAASFMTDWFGGARTLLRDPAQSANVRGRLVTTIKALRAYGCREVIVVAHSGGTMVSWMTLTDPAWPEPPDPEAHHPRRGAQPGLAPRGHQSGHERTPDPCGRQPDGRRRRSPAPEPPLARLLGDQRPRLVRATEPSGRPRPGRWQVHRGEGLEPDEHHRGPRWLLGQRRAVRPAAGPRARHADRRPRCVSVLRRQR